MNRSLIEAIHQRRSYYNISNKSPISDNELKELVSVALRDVPSPFNVPSTKVVLLLGKEHAKLWNIVKETLRAIVSPEKFEKTETKIDHDFASGYATLLFFEDQSVVKGLQDKFPSYAGNFPSWSLQSSGMHQFAIWTLLEDAGFGASLQHYNPLIDEAVQKEWNIAPDWKLISQMPFGVPTAPPGEKNIVPLDERFLIKES